MSKDSMYAQALDEMRDVNPVQSGVGRYAMNDKVQELEDCGVGSEIHLDSDEWGEILYTLKQARYRSEKGHRDYLSGIISKLEAAGIQSND